MISTLNKYPIKQYLIQIMILFYVFYEITITNILIIAIGAIWLFEKDLIQRIKSTFKSPYFLPFISFFLLNMVALLWTSNYYEGFYYLEKRLTLLLFPLILGGLTLTQKSVKHILYTFIFGCFLLGTIGLIIAFSKYVQTGDTAYYYSDLLVRYMRGQGVYLGLYSNLSLIFIFYLYKAGYNFRISKWLVAGLFLFFVTLTFLSTTRNSILAMMLFVVGYLVYSILKEGRYKLAIGGLVVMLVTAVSLSFLFPSTLKRFKSITNYQFTYDNTNPVNQFHGEIKQENWNGLTLRLALWSCGIEVFKNNPLIGVSAGDYIDELMKVYKERNFHYAYEREWGVHNQYIETMVCFGLLGLAVFIYGFIYPVYLSTKKGNYLHALVLILFLLALVTESVLNRFMGIVLFAFFNSLLAYNNLSREN